MNDSEIDQLLRTETPSARPRPDLKHRISAAARTDRKSGPSPVWLALPAAALIALAFLFSRDGTNPTLVNQNPVNSQASPQETLRSNPLAGLNPLDSEARALQDDATRTGQFLLDCLPSLSLAER